MTSRVSGDGLVLGNAPPRQVAAKRHSGLRSRAAPPWPARLTAGWLVAYLLANVALSLISDQSALFSTVWALVTILVGLAVASSQPLDRVAMVAAYIVGAELTWRGTHALVFWEFGKYAVIVVLALGILRFGLVLRGDKRGWLYGAMMVPSLMALPYFDRGEVAFNLSGPASLAIAVVFFSTLRLDRGQVARISGVALGPIVGFGVLALRGTFSVDLSTVLAGNKVVAGGVGPNQASTVLGLGALLAFLLLVLGPRVRVFRLLCGGIAVWLVGQTIATFSRGGVWTALGAALAFGIPLLRSRKSRGRFVLSGVVLALAVQFAVLPTLDALSGGGISRRLRDRHLTGRDKIMKADWIMFKENPVLGVGPGQSFARHVITFQRSAAHTEYSRLLAEHGSFGLMALVFLAWMVWTRWTSPLSPTGKALALGCSAWALLYMFHAAMRLAAPGLLFGLGAAQFVFDEGLTTNRPGHARGPIARAGATGSVRVPSRTAADQVE